MIRRIKPCHAAVIIDARRPLGLFYVREGGTYIGIDNSTGHAWTEKFVSLRQCKSWLRNPSMEAPLLEMDEAS